MYYNNNYLSMQPRQSCVASFQILYGIGKIKASKLNTFLLNHPSQSRFNVHFNEILYPTSGLDMWKKIPKGQKIRLSVRNHLINRVTTFCYQGYRLFQNLPTKGQRTKANGNSIKNHHPFKTLITNISYYQSLEVAYKKRELLYNERYDELKAYTEALSQKDIMKKHDEKEKSRQSKQRFIRNKKRAK